MSALLRYECFKSRWFQSVQHFFIRILTRDRRIWVWTRDIGYFGHGFGHGFGHELGHGLGHRVGQTDFFDFGLGYFALLIEQLFLFVYSIKFNQSRATGANTRSIYLVESDFYKIGRVIWQKYGGGQHIVAIICLTRTKYALKPGQKRNLIGNS